MVRSAGNDRQLGANADEDGYPSDPQVIAVGASSTGGRVADFSEPGACLLVGVPVRDLAGNGVFTTDLIGSAGVNSVGFFPPNQDLSDYVFNAFGFTGTSAAAPEISGIAALLLSANTNLGYRDVQHLLALSARHFDLADPDVTTNGAGLRVGHNLGFGIPDAGEAVRLARAWTNRPSRVSVTLTNNTPLPIPDDGLRVMVSGANVPAELASIQCLPGLGPQVETMTASLPLVDLGLATNAINLDLTNKAALIMRGSNTFEQKIQFAAQAGAAFALIYNFATNESGVGAPGGEQLTIMGGTEFTSIPAFFLRHSAGDALRGVSETNPAARVKIQLTQATSTFTVTNTLLCEHVGLRVQSDHPLRGDLRITLLSPAGTRSVLQAFNMDTSAGPVDWTYWSTHHLLEGSAGVWKAYFADEAAGDTGSVLRADLTIYGTAIVDTDADGLDDNWEQAHFGNLNANPREDPDHDGYSNAREQVMGTDPNVPNAPFRLDLTPFNRQLARLSWPASEHFTYEVLQGTNLAFPLLQVTNLTGQFPEMEYFTPLNNPPTDFLRLRAIPVP
jgi:subtilisin-like proprotein convertase family protein